MTNEATGMMWFTATTGSASMAKFKRFMVLAGLAAICAADAEGAEEGGRAGRGCDCHVWCLAPPGTSFCVHN